VVELSQSGVNKKELCLSLPSHLSPASAQETWGVLHALETGCFFPEQGAKKDTIFYLTPVLLGDPSGGST
jgi:hypothetical protein